MSLCLVERSDAASAKLHLLALSIDVDRRSLNIGLEFALGFVLSVADIVARAGSFATLLTLSHLLSSFYLYLF